MLASALLPALLPVLLTCPPTAVSALDDSHQYGYSGALVEKPALHQWQEVSETADLKHQSSRRPSVMSKPTLSTSESGSWNFSDDCILFLFVLNHNSHHVEAKQFR